MSRSLTTKFGLNDLRAARESGNKLAMLTCYDYSSAQLMQEAGVPILLVGDSAATVVLGYDNTLPVSLDFMIEITKAVRRGASLAMVIGDMPFGSYQASVEQGALNAFRMIQETGCDAVKLEVGPGQADLAYRLADAGVAVVAHLGLRPQAVGQLGGYKFQGRTAQDALAIVALALRMQDAGVAAILLEAVPPEVAKAVVDATRLPVIGCGAGPACHACVIVTHDAIGLTARKPKFVPELGDVSENLKQMFNDYVQRVASQQYPAPEHNYAMPEAERASFEKKLNSAVV